MLDIKRIRQNPDEVKELLAKRNGDFPIDELLELDEKRRKTLVEVEDMKAKQNAVSKEIPKLKKEGKDATDVLNEMKNLSDQVAELNTEVKELDETTGMTVEEKLTQSYISIRNIRSFYYWVLANIKKIESKEI